MRAAATPQSCTSSNGLVHTRLGWVPPTRSVPHALPDPPGQIAKHLAETSLQPFVGKLAAVQFTLDPDIHVKSPPGGANPPQYLGVSLTSPHRVGHGRLSSAP